MTSAHEPVWRRGIGGKVDGESLRLVPGLEMLSHDALVRLAEHAEWGTYKDGTRVTDLAEEKSNVLLVAQGAARVCICPVDRVPLELLSLKPGDAVAPGDFAGLLREDAYLEVQSAPTVILRLSSALYEQEVFSDEAAFRARQQVRRQIQDITRQLWEALYGDALTRIRHELYREWEQSPGDEISLTHAELAVKIGAHREDVTKVLARLRQWGVIDFEPHRHGITVLKPERLAPTHREEEP